MLGYWIDTASKDKMERLVHSTLEHKGEVITLNTWFSKKNAKNKCNRQIKRCLKDIEAKVQYSMKYIFIHICNV